MKLACSVGFVDFGFLSDMAVCNWPHKALQGLNYLDKMGLPLAGRSVYKEGSQNCQIPLLVQFLSSLH